MSKKRIDKLGSTHNTELHQLVTHNQNELLEKAKLHWFYGEWEQLTSYRQEDLENHADRAYLMLLIAAAHHQQGSFETAKLLGLQALKWGGEPKALAKIFIAGAYNTLGRIAALQSNESKMEQAFIESVNVGLAKDIELIAHSRATREMAKLGLFPQASKTIDNRLKDLKDKPSEGKNIAAQTKILQTELELLSHELSLSLQRNQLYKTSQTKKPERDEIKQDVIDTLGYMDILKQKSTSQLGQDIWVLEKTGFKRNGFFVEFGATDGVLLSNSYLLEKEFGWHGICAEPNPKFHEHLKLNRNCIVSSECIGAITGEKVKFVFAQEYGGMQKHLADDMHADKRQSYVEQGKTKEIETISLHDFLIKHNAPKEIDYISIDTEGSEFDILESFPFDEWDVKIFSVEHNYTNLRSKINKVLSEHGYYQVEAQWDDFYIKKEMS